MATRKVYPTRYVLENTDDKEANAKNFKPKQMKGPLLELVKV